MQDFGCPRGYFLGVLGGQFILSGKRGQILLKKVALLKAKTTVDQKIKLVALSEMMKLQVIHILPQHF